MNTHRTNPESLVRAQHRAARAVPPLTVLAIGLAAILALLWLVHPSFAPVEHWQTLGLTWATGIFMTLIVALAIARARRQTLLRSAAEMDAALATHNRLEAATALTAAQNPIARAQREETEQFLQHAHLAPRHRGLAALTAVTLALALAHLVTLACWARSVTPDELDAKKNSTAVAEKKPVAPPSASLEWVTPETESLATAIEEVPLEAEADSTSGLRDVVLELEVNGAHRLSQPVTNNLSQPGRHTLKLSLYLDQLEVKTYDIVSYHLRAQRISTAKLPPTVSEVQFIQVKPLREDTFICAGGDQPSKCFNYVSALKVAQLRMMKENFTLAHAEISRASDEWKQENSRVGTDQTKLAGRADEVIALMTTNNYPPEILGLVRQSQPLMTDAGGKIVKQQNQPALEPQGKALGYLTEVEKYLKHRISLAGKSTQPKANDPFMKPKNIELKTRPLTRAGKIDVLAKEQARLAGDLASGNTNSSLKLPTDEANPGAEQFGGTPGERQAEIKQRIEEFLDDPAFEADALKHLQLSDELAGKSKEQIASSDFAAASEPAAEAARELRQTAAALRTGGNQSAKNRLADSLLQLAAAAGNARRAPQAKNDAEAAEELKKAEAAVRDAANQLAAEAQRQQANGATNAAARLNEMAKLLQGEGLKQMLAQAQSTPRDAAQAESLAKKLDELAARAGQQRNSEPLSRRELAQLVERMQRAQTNLKNLASQCSGGGSGPSQSSAGTKPGQSGKPSESNQPNEAKKSGTGAGSGGGAGVGSGGSLAQATHARGPEMSRDEMLRAAGAQLLDDLRLGGMEARAVGETVHLEKLEQVLREAAEKPIYNTRDFLPIAVELDPPLAGLISVLQKELAGMRRPFELASQEASAAPPAYRPAVADYFEQLSRDYSTNAGGRK